MNHDGGFGLPSVRSQVVFGVIGLLTLILAIGCSRNDVASDFTVASSVSELRGKIGHSGRSVCELLGYYNAGDGGGGMFVWDAASAVSDDAGTTIGATGQTGRWRRLYSGPLNARWFGAKGDGEADDSVAIARAYDAAPAEGGRIYLPAGNFLVSTFPILSKGVAIEGDGGASWVRLADAASITVKATGTALRNFGISPASGNRSSNAAAVIIGDNKAAPYLVAIAGIHVSHFPGDGIRWLNGPNLHVQDVIIDNCGGTGIVMPPGPAAGIDHNHGLFENVQLVNNRGWGMQILRREADGADDDTDSSANVFVNVKAFGNRAGGIHVETRANFGTIFTELNGGSGNGKQLDLAPAATANRFTFLGSWTEFATSLSRQPNEENLLEGISPWEQWQYSRIQTGATVYRKYGGNARFQIRPSGRPDELLIESDNGTSAATVRVKNAAPHGVATLDVDRLKIAGGDASLNGFSTAEYIFDIGALAAGEFKTARTNTKPGHGDIVAVTVVSPKSDMGDIAIGSFIGPDGYLYVRAKNQSATKQIVGRLTLELAAFAH